MSSARSTGATGRIWRTTRRLEILAGAEAAKRALSARGKTRHPVRVLHGVNRSRIDLTRERFVQLTVTKLDPTD